MNATLRRETLPEQLAEELLSFMDRRELRPGDLLPAAATLAAEYRVSRPVVREAMRMLEARGVIRTANGLGAVIQPITHELLSQYFSRAVVVRKESHVELLEVRTGLEMESAFLAATRATDQELRGIDDLVHELATAVGDASIYADLDAQLHLEIAVATHNTMLRYLIESIRVPLKESIEEGLRRRVSFAHHQRIQDLHEGLVHALLDRNPHQASSMMRLHFDEALMAIAGVSPRIDRADQEVSE